MNLESDLSIVCALINRYQPPMKTSKPEDNEIGRKMMRLIQQKNKIQVVCNCDYNFVYDYFHIVL